MLGLFGVLHHGALTARFPVGHGERCCRALEAEAGASLLVVFIGLGSCFSVAAHRGSAAAAGCPTEVRLPRCAALLCVLKHW